MRCWFYSIVMIWHYKYCHMPPPYHRFISNRMPTIKVSACQKEDYSKFSSLELHWQWTLWEIIVTWDSDARPHHRRASPAPTAFGQTQPDYWHWHFAFTQYVGGWWSPNIMLVEIKCKESQKYYNWQVAGTWWRLHYLQLMLRPRRKHNNRQ